MISSLKKVFQNRGKADAFVKVIAWMLSNLGYTKVRPKRLVMATHVHQYHGGGSLVLMIYAHYALEREREREEKRISSR